MPAAIAGKTATVLADPDLPHTYTGHARRWIPTTALAWLAGLGVFLGFAVPLWQPRQSTALIIGIGVSGGLLMAATTALLTGAALRRLLDRTDPRRGQERQRRQGDDIAPTPAVPGRTALPDRNREQARNSALSATRPVGLD
jgi:hypothetical protein